MQPGTILVGVDGSDASTQAAAWAVTQAALERRTLTLVHAVHPGTPVWLDPADNVQEAHRAALESKGRDVLSAARSRLPVLDPDVEVHELVRVGDPRELLVELSETASLLVLGSRGLGRIRSLLLGSTSVALIRNAHCPIVVTRPIPGAARSGVAVGVDTSTSSLAVLDFAFRQAMLKGEPLSIVHTRHFAPDLTRVGTSAETKASPFIDPSWTGDERSIAVADRIAELSEKYPDVRVEALIGEGMPERFLLDLSDRVGLLVVGVHHRGRAAEITFGSMAVWLVEHATCAVAAVPLSTDL